MGTNRIGMLIFLAAVLFWDQMATALLTAWKKVRLQLDKQTKTTGAETQGLAQLTQVFELHVGHAFVMTQAPTNLNASAGQPV